MKLKSIDFMQVLFDFSPTNVGCGLICSHLVNCSVLAGAVISWGFLWPLISQKTDDWYPADLEGIDFKGLYGYKVTKRKNYEQIYPFLFLFS